MSMGTVLRVHDGGQRPILPEMIILRKGVEGKAPRRVRRIMTVTIIGVGYLFNRIL